MLGLSAQVYHIRPNSGICMHATGTLPVKKLALKTKLHRRSWINKLKYSCTIWTSWVGLLCSYMDLDSKHHALKAQRFNYRLNLQNGPKNWMLRLQEITPLRLCMYGHIASKQMHSINRLITLPETNMGPENRPSQSKLVFQPSIFRCYVSCREGNQMGTQATTIWNMVTWLSLSSVQAIRKVIRSPRVFGILSRVFNKAKKNSVNAFPWGTSPKAPRNI